MRITASLSERAKSPAKEFPRPSSRVPAIDRKRSEHQVGRRVQQYFPWVFRLITHPFAVGLVTIVMTAGLSLLSLHYSLAALTLGIAIIAVGRELRFLDTLLLTPNVLSARTPLLGGVIGCTYLASGLTDGDSPGWLAFQLTMIYWLVVSCFVNQACLSRIPAFRMPAATPLFKAEFLRPLSLFAFAILSLELTRQLVGLITGSLDRGNYGEQAAQQVFGIWTYFNIFPRFTTTAMFLAPVIWRAGGWVSRLAVTALVCVLLILGLSTGSRGLFLTPLVFLLAGSYFFLPIRRLPLDVCGLLLAAALTPFVLTMANYRSTTEFRETPGWEVAARVKGFARALTEPTVVYDERDLTMRKRLAFGVQMIALSDNLVYENTPNPVPHVGLENIERIAYVWIPKFIARDKPYLQDGNDIVVGYTGVYFKRSALTISLSADLYRRFAVLGVLIGVPMASILSGLFARWVLNVLLYRDALYGVVLLTLLLSTFHVEMWGTLLSSTFDWLYALPKHLVFGWVLLIAARTIAGAHNKRGLLAYAEPT